MNLKEKQSSVSWIYCKILFPNCQTLNSSTKNHISVFLFQWQLVGDFYTFATITIFQTLRLKQLSFSRTKRLETVLWIKFTWLKAMKPLHGNRLLLTVIQWKSLLPQTFQVQSTFLWLQLFSSTTFNILQYIGFFFHLQLHDQNLRKRWVNLNTIRYLRVTWTFDIRPPKCKFCAMKIDRFPTNLLRLLWRYFSPIFENYYLMATAFNFIRLFSCVTI